MKKPGALGFGNVQFPDTGKVTLCHGGECFSRKSLESDVKQTPEEDLDSPRDAPEADMIASRLSTRYLVWKDEQGRLGFGNVTFPDQNVFRFETQTKDWKLMTN